MLAQLGQNKTQGTIAAILIAAFAVLGLWLGAPPESASAGSFGGVLRAFAVETQTRTILTAILIDVVTGIMAALRTGVFSGERVAAFMQTNVIPYLLGYMLFWFLSYFGLVDLVPGAMTNGIASLGFGAVMGALTLSIVDNLARAQAGSTPPSDALAGNLPPIEPHA